MEEIRHIIGHLLGTCGDTHPNILSLFLGNAEFLNYLQYIIKHRIK